LKQKILAGLAFVLFSMGSVFTAPSETKSPYGEAQKLDHGLGSRVDEVKALQLYRAAVDQGDPRALAWKARKIFKGERGFRKNPGEAKKIFSEIEGRLQKMADQDIPDAARSLAVTWAVLFPSEEGQAAFEVLKKISEQDSSANWASLAWFYKNGIGTEKNPALAFQWYQKSAEGGNVNSQALLGDCYQEGIGVPKNGAEAIRWYRKAADQGLDWAKYRLAHCYEQGIGAKKNSTEAIRWYTEAAEEGDDWAQNKLGDIYSQGQLTERDYAKAYAWYSKAADQGNVTAMVNIGICHQGGNGVPQNEKGAIRWYQKAGGNGEWMGFEQAGQLLCRWNWGKEG